MASCDRDGAVGEVARGYELVKQLQALLHRHAEAPELALSLLREALQALNVALSVMRHPPAIKAEPRELAGDRAVVKSEDGECGEGSNRSGKRKRGEDRSWKSVTAVPHDDGFMWRKYGEKRIRGSDFTRSYFRCTFKDGQGCQATKQIQQKNHNNPPLFQVTYINKHTCCKPEIELNTAFQTISSPNFASASHAITRQEPHLPYSNHSAALLHANDYGSSHNTHSTSTDDDLISVPFDFDVEQMLMDPLMLDVNELGFLFIDYT